MVQPSAGPRARPLVHMAKLTRKRAGQVYMDTCCVCVGTTSGLALGDPSALRLSGSKGSHHMLGPEARPHALDVDRAYPARRLQRRFVKCVKVTMHLLQAIPPLGSEKNLGHPVFAAPHKKKNRLTRSSNNTTKTLSRGPVGRVYHLFFVRGCKHSSLQPAALNFFP
jgi:hypothetical protein